MVAHLHGVRTARMALIVSARSETPITYKLLSYHPFRPTPANEPTANQMQDIKTSLKPTAPALSKRYSKSARYFSPSHRTPSSSDSAISRVDIQHLTIPAALFTDAVDPE